MLLSARLLREAVLQQSALSAERPVLRARQAGARCSTLVLAVHDRCRRCSTRGRRDRASIEELDLAPIAARARRDVAPDDAAGGRADRPTQLIDRARRAAGSAGDDRSSAPIEYRAHRLDSRAAARRARTSTGVGWDEVAAITLDSRRGPARRRARRRPRPRGRRGPRGDVGHAASTRARVAFTGAPMRIPVGEGWLGRVCNGRGEPDRRRAARSLAASSARSPARRSTPRARDAPASRSSPASSAIDGLATLVRGQKLPIFSVGGLPHLELAAQIAAQAHVGGRAVRDRVRRARADRTRTLHAVRDVLERARRRSATSRCSSTPPTTRSSSASLTPRIALTVAEHLAFDLGRHVLVVLADLTSYCEARAPGLGRPRRGARAGAATRATSTATSPRCSSAPGGSRACAGSLTQLPVLTMPAGDITHPGPRPDRLHHRGPARAERPSCTRAASTRRSTRSPRSRG